MRILMTTDTLGGVWTFTQELITGLLQRDCSITLVSFGRTPSDEQRRWCDMITQSSGTEFDYISSDAPLEWMDGNDQAYEQPAALLLHLARSCNADLLHSSQFCFAALPLDIPKILTAHSDVMSWAEACREGKLEESRWLKQYRSLVQRGLSHADTIVAPTSAVAKSLTRHFQCPTQPRIIPNGRSLPALAAPVRKLQAVIAGRLWDEAKDIALLRDVRSPIPILIAGEASQDKRRSLFDYPNATFLGALDQNMLLALFRHSSMYICTSRYEPFGLAPLEAALCGCAVLARDINSLREVWADSALYFHDPPSLTALLHQLANNPRLLSAAQESSAARASLFSSERMTEQYLQLFQAMSAQVVEHGQ